MNCKLDYEIADRSDPKEIVVLNHQLLLARRKDLPSTYRTRKTVESLRVISNPAHLKTIDEKISGDDIKMKVLFAGVACSNQSYSKRNDHYIPQLRGGVPGLATQIGGVCTIANSSDEAIHPGDKIYIDLDKGSGGNFKTGGDEAKRQLGMGRDRTHDIFRIKKDSGTFYVGMALSSAAKGKPFDIKLGQYIA